MKTFNQEELAVMIKELNKFYDQNNVTTVTLLDIKDKIQSAKVRSFTREDAMILIESSLSLCQIVHELVKKAEHDLLAFAPSVLLVSNRSQEQLEAAV